MSTHFQSWYYGEDGTNPLYRLEKFHKFCFLLLFGSILAGIFGPQYDSLGLQLYSPALYFTFVFCMGFGTRMLGPHWDIVIHMNRGAMALVIAIVSLIVSVFIAWLVLPLYLLLFVADVRYKLKVRRTNPQLLEKQQPVYKDLTK